MQGDYQEINFNLHNARRAYGNDELPPSLQFPLDTLSIPTFYPGRYEVEKGERSGSSLTTVSVANVNAEDRIRQEIILLGNSIYAKRGGKSGSGKNSGITTNGIKKYLDELGVGYGQSGLSKSDLLQMLLKRLNITSNASNV